MNTNRSISEQYSDALEAAALAKNEAMRLGKIAERAFAEVFLREDGSVDVRKQRAIINETYKAADDARIAAESAHNLAKAKADAVAVKFEEWRTREATMRAEMNLR